MIPLTFKDVGRQMRKALEDYEAAVNEQFKGEHGRFQAKHTVYQEYRDVLIRYVLSKINERDWHAVSDAANDLRVLEAQWTASNGGSTTPT